MPRAGLTTERVVVAAADLADEIGFEKVSLSALARRFGVKDASLYSHVKNLQDLRTRLAFLAGGEMIDAIAAAVAGRAGKDALTAFAGAYREYALRHPGRYAATQIRIDQALVVCKRGGNFEGGKEFATFVGSAEARPLMQKAGFLLPGETVSTAP